MEEIISRSYSLRESKELATFWEKQALEYYRENCFLGAASAYLNAAQYHLEYEARVSADFKQLRSHYCIESAKEMIVEHDELQRICNQQVVEGFYSETPGISSSMYLGQTYEKQTRKKIVKADPLKCAQVYINAAKHYNDATLVACKENKPVQALTGEFRTSGCCEKANKLLDNVLTHSKMTNILQ